MSSRSTSVLIPGIVLIAAGGLILADNLTDFSVDWWLLLKLLLPILFIWGGVLKLVRHFRWSEEELRAQGGRAGLLSGLFWSGLGKVLLLDILGVVETLEFIGLFWPIWLILFGTGKILDYYRLKGRLQVRPGEIFGIAFIITFGLAARQLSDVHLTFLDEIRIGEIRLPLPIELEKEKFRFVLEEEVLLDSASQVRVENLYGDIQVRTTDGETPRVELVKIISADNRQEAESLASSVSLKQLLSNGGLELSTNREALGERGKVLTTHITVLLPPNLPLELDNSFGDVGVQGREAACVVSNSYGQVRIRSVRGDLVVSNQYEDVRVQNVEGTVQIENRRGAVFAEDIRGELRIETNYDRVAVDRVEGRLWLKNHFGTVRLAHVEGSAEIDAAGSAVTLLDVSRDVQVRSSHKDLTARNVQGQLAVQTSYNKVRLEDIGGNVRLQTAHSEVVAKGLRAGISAQGRGSQMLLNGIEGSVEVATTLRRVVLEEFSGPVRIENEYGEVTLDPKKAPRGRIRVINKNGDIRLTLPAQANFRLSAQSLGGGIQSDFGRATADEKGEELAVLEISEGAGGPEIELQTTYSRIQIKRRG